jgi:hypothetical protein
VNANGTNGETKATGAAAKAARQAKMSVVRTDEQTTELTTPPVEQPKPEKQPAKPKAEKPQVDRLARVIEQQANPTMWQYARIAKAIKQRTEAGQNEQEATLAVMDQVVEIVSGILAQGPETSSDAHIDSATRAYFEQAHPASASRQRGPKDSAPETTGEPSE